MPTRQEIARALESIFFGIAHLKSSFPNRKFAIDERLVGHIGEVIAAMIYGIELDEVSQPFYDGAATNVTRLRQRFRVPSRLVSPPKGKLPLCLKLAMLQLRAD